MKLNEVKKVSENLLSMWVEEIKIINRFNFDMDTLIFDGTMLEGIKRDEIEELKREVKGKIFKHEKGTNISYPRYINKNLYDITYIDKEGYMFSEIDLNIMELTMRIEELKDKLDRDCLNIFKAEERIELNM